MITVPALSATPLPHRAFHTAIAARSGDILAVDQDGRGTLIAPDRKTLSPLRLPSAESVAIHPDGEQVAVATEDSLLLFDRQTGAIQSSAEGHFDGCHFSGDGGFLWACRRPSESEAILELRSVAHGDVIASTSIVDPFGASAFLLSAGAHESSISVWVAAGQDGQAIYWASLRDRTIAVERFDTLRFTGPPSFAPSGDSFLVIAHHTELHHYEHTSGFRRATIPWPFEDGDDRYGDSVTFAGEKHALFATNEGRIHLVDLERRVVLDEVIISAPELHPQRENVALPMSREGQCDLSYFLPIGAGKFLSVHHRFPPSGSDWTSDLLTWQFNPRDFLPDQEQGAFAF